MALLEAILWLIVVALVVFWVVGFFFANLGSIVWIALVVAAIILIYNLLLYVLGAPLETSTVIVITMPLLFTAFTRLGFDPLWLGVMTTVNSEIGSISPPSGLVLFAMKRIAPSNFTTRDIYLSALPFTAVLLLFLLIVILFPPLSTWLPSHMKG